MVPEIPDLLAQQLDEEMISPVLFAQESDLLPDGEFGLQWVLITRTHWFTFREKPDGSWKQIEQVSLTEISEPKTLHLKGCAALSCRDARGHTRELIRYTNRRKARFERIAGFLRRVEKFHKATNEGDDASFPQLNAKDREPEERCQRCDSPFQKNSKVCPKCVDRKKVLKRFGQYLKPHWKSLGIISCLMFLGSAASLLTPYLQVPLMDKVLAPKQDAISLLDDRYKLLGWIVIGMIAVRLIHLAIEIFHLRALEFLAMGVTNHLRKDVYQAIQKHSVRYFDKRSVGSISARVIQDTSDLQFQISHLGKTLLVDLITFIGIGAILFWLNWKLTLFVLVPVPLIVLFSKFYIKKIRSGWARAYFFQNRLYSRVTDSISGIRVVRAFAQEDKETRAFRDHNDQAVQSSLKAEITWASLQPVLSFCLTSGSFLVWYIGGGSVLGEGMSLGELVAYNCYLGMFYGPLSILGLIQGWITRAYASADRVFEVLDTPIEVKDTTKPVPVDSMKGDVEFRNVVFSYEDGEPAQDHISFKVKAGEMIGLCGQSGAGKSTLINLLCRFYDADEGEILIDGINIREISQQDLRSHMGVVLQNTFLFNDTILENIRYAKPDAELMDVMQAAKAANAHEFILQKKDGYETMLEGSGENLSGGERQRIAIARAILHDPAILILDEATASVDTDTEQKIQEALYRLTRNRTTFAIAHRLSTLKHADRLFVLKSGKVIESGTHEELLAKENGEFRRLVDAQKEMSSIVAIDS